MVSMKSMKQTKVIRKYEECWNMKIMKQIKVIRRNGEYEWR